MVVIHEAQINYLGKVTILGVASINFKEMILQYQIQRSVHASYM